MFIDAVVVKQGNGRYLFSAPAFSDIKSGDEVEVETKHGKQTGTVVAISTVDADTDGFKFIVDALGAKLPLKRVLSYMKKKEIRYPEQEENA